MIQWYLGSSPFFLIIDDTVALDCILNSCPVPQKLTMPPQTKKIPCYFLNCDSLWFLSYYFFLIFFVLSLDLQLHHIFISKLLMLHSKEFNVIRNE